MKQQSTRDGAQIHAVRVPPLITHKTHRLFVSFTSMYVITRSDIANTSHVQHSNYGNTKDCAWLTSEAQGVLVDAN